ncbi:MAG: hypothetical protein KKA10_09545, partial [Euryarchaeota archaeon]|nr:hypothetical protein [Euryarchaeota archaeon]
GFISSRSSGETLNSNFMRFGYALIPLGLGIHLAHNAKHFLVRCTQHTGYLRTIRIQKLR